eukprot:6865379-Alexandrium_andersonii.AAC.1
MGRPLGIGKWRRRAQSSLHISWMYDQPTSWYAAVSSMSTSTPVSSRIPRAAATGPNSAPCGRPLGKPQWLWPPCLPL